MKLLKLPHHTCGLPSLARPGPLGSTSIGRRVAPPSLGSWSIKSKSQKRLFSSFTKRAERILNHNGTVTFEWPRSCSGWKRPDVVAFFEKHPQFMCVDFEGCAVGLTTRDGLPLKKPWRLMTTSQRIRDVFQDKRCKRARCEGG